MSKDTEVKGRKVDIPANPKQRLAWQAWENDLVDDVVYGGAAGGGKTMLACQVLTGTALKYPGSRQFLGRKELKALMNTSFITLTQKVFPQYGLEQDKHWRYDGKYNVMHFKNGTYDDESTIAMLDLDQMPSDPLFQRFGSHEYTRGWIEEASEVPFKAYDVLKSRVGRWQNTERGIKSKLGLGLNPSQDWPYRMFYNVWVKAGRPTDPNKPLTSIEGFDAEGKLEKRTFVFIPALYTDNPFAAGEYAKNLATLSDPVLKARLMQGDWEYASAADTLFDASTIADLFTNQVKVSNDQFMTVDVARFGGDLIVITYWRGWEAHKIETYTMLATHQTADLVRTGMMRYGIPREHVLVDADGVGGGVIDLLPGCIPFSGGSSPFGKVGEKDARENYDNLRTQCAYHLAEMARARKVAVSEMSLEVRELVAQDLQQLKRRDVDKDGRLKIAKKEDIKSALGRSPDIGDTLMMRSYFDLREREPEAFGGGTISVVIPDLGF